ncbi:MAG: hypothetical protein K2K39_00135 [Clostridia bacterium]|nr:hypothetical protein [Clostridia bacterium]
MERDLSAIAGTLKYGVFIGVSRRREVFSYFILAAVWVLIVAAVVGVICLVRFCTEFMSADWFVISLTVLPVAFSILPAVFLAANIRNSRSRKEIIVWLEDAVELEAYSTSIADIDSGVSQTMARIQVEFEFNGERLSRVSEGRMIGEKDSPDGYHVIWTDYADRKIKILYSPKYDQVLVLKD